MNKPVAKDKLLAFYLTLPALLFYAGYFFNHDASLIPTGFIQDDNVSYIAYARQYLDHSGFDLLYCNPLSDGPHQPIYFQPQTLLLAGLLKAGVAPGLSLCIFSLIFIYLSFLLLIRVAGQFTANSKYSTWIVVVWAWGGGLLTISGFLLNSIFESSNAGFFFLDPGSGWWGLNFGRSLLFSLESYYHFLFLLAVFCLLQKRWLLAGSTIFILSLSHPFTGLELIIIVLLWICVEKIFFSREKRIPLSMLYAVLGIGIFHIGYYLWFLPAFPEHKAVFEQYSLNWRLRYFQMIPAWIFVFSLTVLSYRVLSIGAFTQTAARRLAVCWLLGALLLSNHELFVSARQPIHFARGYVYSGFLLLGIPGLEWVISHFKRKRKIILFAACMLIFGDNASWLILRFQYRAKISSVRYIDSQQQELLNWLGKHATENCLLVSSGDLLPYLATAWSPAYAWTAHPFTTPYYSRKKETFNTFYHSGTIPAEWQRRKVWWIINLDNKEDKLAVQNISNPSQTLSQFGQYRIIEISRGE